MPDDMILVFSRFSILYGERDITYGRGLVVTNTKSWCELVDHRSAA